MTKTEAKIATQGAKGKLAIMSLPPAGSVKNTSNAMAACNKS
ncbi:hypothetical protein ACNKHP_18365 [Shigella boydii]